jgi:hypothetical protein
MVDAGQMINGERHLPSAEMHSTAVTRVRLTAALLHFLQSTFVDYILSRG